MIQYKLQIDKPESHLARIAVRVERMSETVLHFKLHAWSPGSYQIRDYVKNIVQVEAADDSGRALPVKKTDKQTWRVEVQEAKAVVFSYQIYCHEIGTQ